MKTYINSDEYIKNLSGKNFEQLVNEFSERQLKALKSIGFSNMEQFRNMENSLKSDTILMKVKENYDIQKLKNFYILYIAYYKSDDFKNMMKSKTDISQERERRDKILLQACGFIDIKDFENTSRNYISNPEIRELNDKLNATSVEVMSEISREIQGKR